MTKSEYEMQNPLQLYEEIINKSRFVDNTLTFQEIMRLYAHHLSPTQLAVLFFIMDRTVGWGKRWEIITQQHFLFGIQSHEEDNLDYAGSLKISLNTLKSALRKLLKYGLILEMKGLGKNKNLTAYSLNENYFSRLPKDKRS